MPIRPTKNEEFFFSCFLKHLDSHPIDGKWQDFRAARKAGLLCVGYLKFQKGAKIHSQKRKLFRF